MMTAGVFQASRSISLGKIDTERVTRLRHTQEILTGKAIVDTTLHRAREAAVAETTLVADTRGSMFYKQQFVRACSGRAVRMAPANGVGK